MKNKHFTSLDEPTWHDKKFNRAPLDPYNRSPWSFLRRFCIEVTPISTTSLGSGDVWGQSSTKFHRKISLLWEHLQTDPRKERPAKWVSTGILIILCLCMPILFAFSVTRFQLIASCFGISYCPKNEVLKSLKLVIDSENVLVKVAYNLLVVYLGFGKPVIWEWHQNVNHPRWPGINVIPEVPYFNW